MGQTEAMLLGRGHSNLTKSKLFLILKRKKERKRREEINNKQYKTSQKEGLGHSKAMLVRRPLGWRFFLIRKAGT